jgi:formylglycine-generating enzyme required for sulfatase activity
MLFTVLFYISPVVAEKRVALVVGNSQYAGDYLRNAHNDAEDMAQVLRQYGFTVIHQQNLNQVDMENAIIDFGKRLSKDGVGLFYYAGHGMQIDQHNYLIPIGPEIREAKLLKYRAVDAQWVVDVMDSGGSRVNILILDACRNNPFRSYFRSQEGLAAMSTPRGTIISYATALGKKASDGVGHNSLYTQHLLEAIQRPGLTIEQVFKQTATNVALVSGDKQVPWMASSLTGKDFCFSACGKKTDEQALRQRVAELEQRLALSSAVMAPKSQPPLNKDRTPGTVMPPKPAFSEDWTPGNVFRDKLPDKSLGPEMVVIPAGHFKMGDIQRVGESDEQPVHWVSLNSFAMSRYEVTFAEYDRFATTTNRQKPKDRNWGRDNRPVIYVSLEDATAYTEWLSRQTGRHYRLPTEAEWEYSARAGTQTQYWWGNEIGTNRANCWDCATQKDDKMTVPVGSFSPNPFGLYEMVGNVREWTCSAYENKYNGAEQRCADKNDRKSRPLRGGSWFNIAKNCRSANRDRFPLDGKSSYIGFRVVANGGVKGVSHLSK